MKCKEEDVVRRSALRFALTNESKGTFLYTLRLRIRMRRSLLPLLLIGLLTITVAAQTQKPSGWPPSANHTTMRLWPNGAPGLATAKGPEQDTTTATDHQVAGRAVLRLGNVSSPTISLYFAHSDSAGASGGPAVVVFPGGAYRIVAIDLEGTEVCDWLNSIGVNCVLLKYRVPDTGPFPKSEAAL